MATLRRRTPMPARIPGVFAVQQGLARALINGVLLLLAITVATVAPAGQALAMTAAAAPAAAPTVATSAAVQDLPRTAPQVATETVTVTDGGARTWWDLAGAHLGDGAAWRQLWDLNRGRVQADGTTLSTERGMLQTGWTILVPATTSAPSITAVTPTVTAPVVGGKEVTVQRRHDDHEALEPHADVHDDRDHEADRDARAQTLRPEQLR